ncbi:MAG: cell division protein ZipA [Pseudomonadales bacterium]|mgnify:FL=1|nr:cell division protein ZipA [Pseudomonadales bacterium]
MDIKDLILLVGGFFFVAVVGHGLWVAWKTKQGDISMDISPSPLAGGEAEINDLSKSEFPSGGARIATPSAEIEPVLDASPQPAQGSLPLDDFTEQLATQPSKNSQDGAQTQTRQQNSASDASLRSEAKPGAKSGGKADAKPGQSVAQKTVSDESEKRSAPASPDELIILGVLAKSGAVFKGPELVAALRGQGLKFGNMSIFHRIDSATDEHLFSVANAVEPGTFDLADMEALETPGITFFLQLPVPGDAFETLEDMLLSARTVAAALGGDVKDDQMNTLTGQTVEHMRQRLSDYARRRLTQRPEQ